LPLSDELQLRKGEHQFDRLCFNNEILYMNELFTRWLGIVFVTAGFVLYVIAVVVFVIALAKSGLAQQALRTQPTPY
jgi:hypothetical protein